MFTVIGPNVEKHEPVDLATLSGWVAQGRIQPQTTIIEESTGRRFVAGQMPELKAAFSSSSPQASLRAVTLPSLVLVNCPACTRQLSAQAVSCPQCGHPMSVADNWSQASRVGGYVSLAIGVLMFGAQAVVLKFFAVDETLLQVFLQTSPLTLAVTIISLSAIQDWFENFGALLGFSAVTLLLSLFLGNWLGGLGKIPTVEGNAGVVIFQSLAFYWSRYGASLFLSSLILGIFLAWATNKLTSKPVSIASQKKGGNEADFSELVS